jgi:hypothetical protein
MKKIIKFLDCEENFMEIKKNIELKAERQLGHY